MTTGLFGASSIGAANLTKLSFLQPMLLSDIRTNVLPGFLHTLKIAEQRRLDRSGTRRLRGRRGRRRDSLRPLLYSRRFYCPPVAAVPALEGALVVSEVDALSGAGALASGAEGDSGCDG